MAESLEGQIVCVLTFGAAGDPPEVLGVFANFKAAEDARDAAIALDKHMYPAYPRRYAQNAFNYGIEEHTIR